LASWPTRCAVAITNPTRKPTRRPLRITGLPADQSQTVMADRGGEGGSGNKAEGGDVHFKAGIESANLNDGLNDSKYFRVNDFVHV
jgi:hypothetical protein